MTNVIIENDNLQIGILPKSGACLSFMACKQKNANINILRPLAGGTGHEALQSALFPVAPFCQHIQGGSFVYWGITRRIKKNKPGEADPIYGDTWNKAWKIEEKSSHSITLKFDHDKKEGGYPFSYKATVIYALNGATLDITLQVQNPDVLPMPCGLGIRPFFIKTDETTLRFHASDVWANGKDPIFGSPYTLPSAWDFSEGAPVTKKTFNTCFGGFAGTAEVVYPQHNVRVIMQADNQMRHVALETTPRKNYFCLEPDTCTDDAFNLAFAGVVGTGIKSIGPRETASIHVSLSVKGS